ncbi:dipeptidase [Phenylobacterium sp.]|uniref:dipeptidase n=1 Tax=Phenylobacterium sp. TaxID=1871053 RepID=UPI0035ADF3F1
MKIRTVSLAALILAASLSAARAETPAEAAHAAALVLDTHFDTPANFHIPGWDIMDRHDVNVDGSQVDYPRMVEGGVDGGFFAIFTPQGPRTPEGDAAARDAAIVRAVEIHEMVAKHGDKFELATKAEDAPRIAAEGKRFVFMSIENSYPLGDDLTLMQTFYKLGVRMIGPIHFLNNDLGDSSTDPKGPEWHGLSPLGKQFVAEANRLGMVIDASHSSNEATEQMIELSKTPIILSHSGVAAVFDHPRNVPDEILKKLAAKGGVIQINAFNNYMIATPKIPEREAAMADLMKSIGFDGHDMTPDQRKAFIAGRKAIDAKWPVPKADIDDFMKHMFHAIQVVGVDHVGVSGDFDGGGGIEGLMDVTYYPEITKRLMAAGYTKEDVAKIWGGNALRVLKAADEAKAQ